MLTSPGNYKGRVLVVGATGRTGRHVVEILHKRGVQLRLLVRDREFAEILRRVPAERPLPWYQRVVHTTGVVALATTASALALALVLGPPEPVLEDSPLDGISAALPGARVAADAARTGSDPEVASDDEPASVAPHQAQVDYGRVIAGRGFLSARGDGPPVLTDTFTVGTRFSVEPTRPGEASQSLQVGLLGRILANFEPGTEIEWTQASPGAIDLTLERGDPAGARTHYERAIAIYTAISDSDILELAMARFGLARALSAASGGLAPAARELAEQALAALTHHGPAYAPEQKAVRAWLSARAR